MHEERKKRGESRQPACIARIGVSRCQCGAWHLRYRYVDVTIRAETLYLIMEECFRYEEAIAANNLVGLEPPGPMTFTLGLVTITILPMDYAAFSRAIGNAVNEDMGIGRLLGVLASEERSRNKE